MNKYNQEVYTPPQVSHQYLHTMTAGAWLPFAQACITGGIAAALVMVLAVYVRARSPLVWSVIVGAVVMGLTWFRLQSHWFRLTDLEKLTGLDLDRDGRVGESSPQEVRVRVQDIKPSGHYHEDIYFLPGNADQLSTLARGILEDGLAFSERTWTGAGRPFSVDEFRRLRSELIRRGLLSLANPKDTRQGFLLTLAGRHALAAFLEVSPSPSEPVEVV